MDCNKKNCELAPETCEALVAAVGAANVKATEGGVTVTVCSTEQVAAVESSFTGQFLKKILN